MRLAAAALLGCAAAGGPFEPSGCQQALYTLSSQGHTDFELVALCHARLPPAACREASSALGRQPWTEAHIATACERWEVQWNGVKGSAGRGVMDWQYVQETMNTCMHEKSEAGLCKDANTGKPMSMDACIDYKQKMYPEKTKKMTDALNSFYSAAMGVPQQKFEETSSVGSTFSPGLGLPMGVGLMVTMAAVGSFVGLRRVQRQREGKELDEAPLVGADESTEDDA